MRYAHGLLTCVNRMKVRGKVCECLFGDFCWVFVRAGRGGWLVIYIYFIYIYCSSRFLNTISACYFCLLTCYSPHLIMKDDNELEREEPQLHYPESTKVTLEEPICFALISLQADTALEKSPVSVDLDFLPPVFQGYRPR